MVSLGVLDKFRRNRKIKKELTDKINNKDYDSVKQILIREICLGNYNFVNYRVLHINMPKEYFEELLTVVENLPRPPHHKRPFRPLYSSLKSALEMRRDEFKRGEKSIKSTLS